MYISYFPNVTLQNIRTLKLAFSSKILIIEVFFIDLHISIFGLLSSQDCENTSEQFRVRIIGVQINVQIPLHSVETLKNTMSSSLILLALPIDL